jgi:hypothetical protein
LTLSRQGEGAYHSSEALWRVTLLSIQASPLKIVQRRTMDKLLSYRTMVNPAYGIKEVEFSNLEVKEFRMNNLKERSSHHKANSGETDGLCK